MYPQTLSQRKKYTKTGIYDSSKERLGVLKKYLSKEPCLIKEEYGELKFFQELESWIKKNNKNWRIFTKVRIADLAEIKNEPVNKDDIFKWVGEWNKISQKHFDFVITNNVGRVICCMELNGSSHNESDREESDVIKEELCKDIRIGLHYVERNDTSNYIEKLNILNRYY